MMFLTIVIEWVLTQIPNILNSIHEIGEIISSWS